MFLQNFREAQKQAIFYHEFYVKFYEYFDQTQKAMFLFCCKQIKDKINEYSSALRKEGRDKNIDIQKIDRKIDYVISDIIKEIKEEPVLV